MQLLWYDVQTELSTCFFDPIMAVLIAASKHFEICKIFYDPPVFQMMIQLL